MGHKLYKCPLRKTMNILERNEEEGVFYEASDQKEEYEAYKGHTYVVRRMMLTLKINEDQTQ